MLNVEIMFFLFDAVFTAFMAILLPFFGGLLGFIGGLAFSSTSYIVSKLNSRNCETIFSKI